MQGQDSNHRPGDQKKKHFLKPVDAKAHLIFWSIAVLGLIADLWSKHAVFEWLGNLPGRQFQIIEGLCEFVMRLNDGGAFSIASGQRAILISVSIVAMVAVFGIFLFGHATRRIMQVAMGLFAAGITGNLYDRIFNDGFVRDFIDVYWGDWHWPAFNVADSMLCIAVGIMIIANLTSPSSQKPDHRQKQEP